MSLSSGGLTEKISTEIPRDVLNAGPWEGSLESFAASGFQCPVFKNPTDYYMAIASDPENHAALLAAQEKRTSELAAAQAERVASDVGKKANDVLREVHNV